MKKLLALLCAMPYTKLKSAISINRLMGTPSGEAINSRSCPIANLTIHTKTSAANATSKKVGLKPMLKGRLAKGRMKTTPANATKPQCVSRIISAPPTSATAAASEISGPAMPMKSAISAAPAAQTAVSAVTRTQREGENAKRCAPS